MSRPDSDLVRFQARPRTPLGRVRAPVAVAMLALHLGGCVSWAPTARPPAALIREERPPRIRVTTADGAQQVLRFPRIRGDSLLATARECRPSIDAPGGRVCETTSSAIAVADIRTVATPYSDPVKTVVVVVLGASVVLGTGFVLAMLATCGAVPCG